MKEEEKEITVWITKYALTSGILKHSAKLCGSPGMIQVPAMGAHAYFHGKGRDWHDTESDAIRAAEAMRVKKLKSIEEQIARIKAIKF